MAKIKPFRALRFTEKAGNIKELVCPPYDIISEGQRRDYLKTNPNNIIRLELPKEGENPYEEAGKTLGHWLDGEILKIDDKPALYVYEEEFEALGETRKIKGFTCRVKLEEFEKGIVLPHEETLSKAKADRFELMKATNCNFSPIYSLYFDEDHTIYNIIDGASKGKPDIEFASDDGIIHRLWVITDEAVTSKVTELMADKKIYIADGHHRYETALNYRKHLAVQGKIDDKDSAAGYIMMTLMNMENDGLVVFPTHRIVRDLENFDDAKMQSVLENLKQYFELLSCETDKAESVLNEYAKNGRKAFGLYYNGKVTILLLKDASVMNGILPEQSAAYQGLDVTILHTLILERSFGIDKENMANQKNLIYARDISTAIAAVDKKEADFAFIINATRVDEIAAVAGAGEKMPQKSTYFYPKLITGMVMNELT